MPAPRAGAVQVGRQKYAFDFSSPEREWRFVGGDMTPIPSETYPPDPGLLRAIKSLDPQLQYLWIRFAYLSPTGALHVLGRHGWGRWHTSTEVYHDPRIIPPMFWPPHRPRPAGQLVLEPELTGLFQARRAADEDDPSRPDLGGFVPLGWGFYHLLSALIRQSNERGTPWSEAHRSISARADARDRAKAALDAEADYRFDHDYNFIRRTVEKVSGPELDEWGYNSRKAGTGTDTGTSH